MHEVIQYYDELAPRYDEDRFRNAYGRYLDRQERQILCEWLKPYRGDRIMDLACGTGRLLDFATHGVDASAQMLHQARRKHPDKQLFCMSAEELVGMETSFDVIFCFHLFMHLPKKDFIAILKACHSRLRRGGLFVFDFPTTARRRLTRTRTTGWHGATSFDRAEIRQTIGAQWQIEASRGLLFIPIHRIPLKFRFLFRHLDDAVGATPLKTWSSYQVLKLKRQ